MMQQSQRPPFGTTLAAALALHAALLFLVAKVKLAEPVESAPPEGPPPTELDLTEPATPRPAGPKAPKDRQPADRELRRPEKADAARAKSAESHPTEPQASAPSPPESSSEPASGPAGGYSLDPSAPSGPRLGPKVELGIGASDWQRFSPPGGPGEQANVPDRQRAPGSGPVAPPLSTTGGLAGALEAHDREVGLGHGGPVLSAAHDAAHSDVAPALGTATLVITVLATGAVDVQVTGASSQFADWQKVAARMAKNIAQKPPRVRPPRRGVRIGLELTAVEKWPNGAPARGTDLHVFTTGKLESTAEAQESLAHLNPTAVPPPGSPAETPTLVANVDLPGIWVGARGKICNFRLGVTPLGPMLQGGCDPSNIGAKPQRVVSAHVTSETMF